jgi:hypothetical protein
LASVNYSARRRAGKPGPLLKSVQFLTSLTDVHRDAVHLGPVFLREPRDRHRGIQSARISQRYALY